MLIMLYSVYNIGVQICVNLIQKLKKHIPIDSTIKELDDIMSRVNGLEVSSTDEYQRAITSVLKTLVQGEITLFKEFEHLKKAIDLVTLEMFKLKNKSQFYSNSDIFSVVESIQVLLLTSLQIGLYLVIIFLTNCFRSGSLDSHIG